MLKLPSLQHLGSETLRVAGRFATPIIITIVGTWAALSLIEQDGQINDEYYVKIMMTCLIGLPLLLAACLFAETWQSPKAINPDAHNEASHTKVAAVAQLGAITWLWQGLGLILLAIYYFSLPEPPYLDRYAEIIMTRFVLLFLSVHFLVAIVPYLKQGSVNGFWQYNQILFTRILTAFSYSVVLFIGLMVALLAIDNLFDVNINEKNYMRLFVCIAGLFNTFFFLAGVPQNFSALDQDNSYPFGLKVFTQYVLIPLVTIYLAILYAYIVKILLEWQLPVGWVSYLVLCFSVVGILAILLVYPIRHQAENTWIRSYRSFFFLALVPLIVLLYIAIMRRILDYGFTENRYFVFVMAAWLAGITIYFNVSKSRNIKILPLSLCLITLLSSFGPWGAFSVSKRSQQTRLSNLLQANNMLSPAKIAIPASKTVSDTTQNQISEILRYLYSKHGSQAVQPYFELNIDTLANHIAQYNVPDSLSHLLRINSNVANAVIEMGIDLYANQEQNIVQVSGYDMAINHFNSQVTEGHSFVYENKKYLSRYNEKNMTLELSLDDNIIASLKMDTIAQRLYAHYTKTQNNTLTSDMLTSHTETPAAKMSLSFRNLNLQKQTDTCKIGYFDATVLLKLKQ